MIKLRILAPLMIVTFVGLVLPAQRLQADEAKSPHAAPRGGESQPQPTASQTPPKGFHKVGVICKTIDFQPGKSQTPPEGAIVLFDGKGVNRFVSRTGDPINWPVEDGALVSTPSGKHSNHIVSTYRFRDADLHAEFMLPEKGSGNSGLYLHGNYELQIFNSFGKTEPSEHDAGALYGFAKPAVNAVRPPGQWQVYDLRYIAPRRDAQGNITTEGSITAWLNGQEVQHETRFGEPRSVYHPYRYQTTPYLQAIGEQQKKTSIGPLFLQDHGAPVRFRNLWLKPLDDQHHDAASPR